MKKILRYLAVAAAVGMFFASCSTEKDFENEKPFLYQGDGRWTGSNGNFVFRSDGTGKWWNEAEDIQENESRKLEWSVSGERFTYRREMNIGAGWGAYNDFTIIDLTTTTFKYRNASGTTYTMQKDS